MEEKDFEYIFRSDQDITFHLEIIVDVLEQANKSETRFLADLTLAFIKMGRKLRNFITQEQLEQLLNTLSTDDLNTIELLNLMKISLFEMENKFDQLQKDEDDE